MIVCKSGLKILRCRLNLRIFLHKKKLDHRVLEKTRFEALCYFINSIIDSKSPKEKLKSLIDEADHIFKFRGSRKHLSGVTMAIKQLHLAA